MEASAQVLRGLIGPFHFLAHRMHLHEERGQGLVEYGLIVSLIAIVVIVVVQVVGHQVNNVFSNVSNGLST